MVLLLPAATARADSVIGLGTELPNGLAVDDAHVFLAMPDSGTVQVRSYIGALVTTVPEQTGAFRLTLSSDRSRVFVLLSDGHITAIDTTSLAEVGRWTLPTGTCGQDIAWAGVALFVAYKDCLFGDAFVAALDTADPTAHLSTPFAHQPAGAGGMAIAGGGNVLVTDFGDGSSTEITVVSFDASTVPPTQLASATAGEYCYDSTVTADGSEVTVACAGALTTRRTSDLEVTESYSGPYATWQPSGVAESSGVLAFSGDSDQFIYRYLRGRSSRLRSTNLRVSESVWQSQLAFSPDASRLFAVTRSTDGGNVTRRDLRIVTFPGLVPLQPSLSLTSDKSTYSYGANALVTAHLGATYNNRRVDIYATPHNGSRQLIKSGDVNAAGTLAVRYSLTRTTTFTAVFTADDRYASRSVSHSITPRAVVHETLYGAYGTKGKYAFYRPKKDPVIGVVVLPDQRRAHGCLRYKLQRRASGAWHKVATNRCRKLGGDNASFGRLDGPHVDGSRFRLRAILHGSDVSARTKGAWCYIRFRHR